MTPQFFTIFRWQVLRNLRGRPLLALINVLSIALGIAVYLAIQIANDSANASFNASVELVAGKAHLEVRGDVDEKLWPALARASGVKAATAVVQGVVTLPDFPGEFLQVTGVDLFTGEPFRTWEVERRAGSTGADWLGTPGGIALNKSFALQHGLKPGDRISVFANGVVRSVTLLALIDARDSPADAQPRFAVMDIGWAQELLSSQGRLSAIQLLLERSDRAPATADELRASLPPHLQVGPPRQRSFQMQQMLGAFRLNLTALSMVSLLVGTFLIFNTVSGSVARRRTEIGILRALGTTQLEVRTLFLGEAVLFGVLGIALGAAGGVLLAQALLARVAQTISSLYVLVSVGQSDLSPVQFLTAGFLGFGAVLLGAWIPAREASRVDAVRALSLGGLEVSQEKPPPAWHWGGAICLAGAAVISWLALRTGPPALSFAAAFLVLAGAAMFSPKATLGFGRVCDAVTPLPVTWRMAADHLRRSVHRNSVTVAALAAAISMSVGLTIMIFSFRRSVDTWVARGVVADLYVTPSSNETVGLGATIPPEAIAWLRAQSGVDAVDTFRELDVSVEAGGRDAQTALLAVVEGVYRGNMSFHGGSEAAKMARVFAGEAVAVTESFARKFRVRAGSAITLLTPRGPAAIAVAGVYADYTRDQGVILISREHFSRFWNDAAVQSLAIYLRDAVAPQQVADDFRKRFGRNGEFAIYSNRMLRERILSIFDQAFAVTYVMRSVAILVAVAGIFLSVSTLVAERSREIGVLRAIGATRGQIQWLFMSEAMMIGAIASVLGVAAGVVLAVVLTSVVNPAFFGWTMQFHWPWWSVFSTPLWILPTALIAAWYPAWQAGRTEIAGAVREE